MQRADTAGPVEIVPDELADELMARHVEVNTLAELMGTENQRATPIPALYSMWYRFVQNPSTVSVETAKRMIDTDETIGSGIDFMISCLVARLGAYQHDDPEVTRFVARALSEIAGGWTDACKEILSACWAGFSVTEMVWANKEVGFVPQKLVTVPPTTILFEADRVGDITEDGILQYQRNFFNSAMGSGFGLGLGSLTGLNGFVSRPDPFAKFGDLPFPLRAPNALNYMAIRIPKQKCIHFTWNGPGRFGNPYGRMMLRRAYNWWVQKWAYTQMMGTALDRKGTPLTVLFADQNASIVKDPAKAGSSERKTRSDMVSAAVAGANAFANVHNDSVVTLPGMRGQIFDIEQLQNDANSAGFVEVLQFCNAMLMRALLIPSLIFTSGDGSGSYSLGQEHAKTFDKILDGYLEGFKTVLLDQFIRQLIAFNFPKNVWQEKGLGGFARRELTVDEREKEANMFATAIDKGIVDTNDLADLNKMREAMGFEPRTEPIPKPAPLDPFGNPMNPFGDENAEGAEDGGGDAAGDDEGKGGEEAGGEGKRLPPGIKSGGGGGGRNGPVRPAAPGRGAGGADAPQAE